MSKPKHAYDEKCEELARHFYPDAPADFIADLAQSFQDAAESACSHDVVNGQSRCARCGEEQ